MRNAIIIKPAGNLWIEVNGNGNLIVTTGMCQIIEINDGIVPSIEKDDDGEICVVITS